MININMFLSIRILLKKEKKDKISNHYYMENVYIAFMIIITQSYNPDNGPTISGGIFLMLSN